MHTSSTSADRQRVVDGMSKGICRIACRGERQSSLWICDQGLSDKTHVWQRPCFRGIIRRSSKSVQASRQAAHGQSEQARTRLGNRMSGGWCVLDCVSAAGEVVLIPLVLVLAVVLAAFGTYIPCSAFCGDLFVTG